MSDVLERQPAVAGQFYPKEADRLRETVRMYMKQSNVEPGGDYVLGMMAPHAGYIYSGPTAGFAYARIRGKKPKRVVLLGCSHRYHITAAATCTRGVFMTPLGAFPIDEDFASKLAAHLGTSSAEPHMLEHSLEVQLPFLAEAVGFVPIVPVLFGAPTREWHGRFGEILAEWLDPGDLVVASTDLSHYKNEREANALDRQTIRAIESGDWRLFVRGVIDESFVLCGAAAVTAALACSAARGAKAFRLLDYRTSAGASGDFERVVGYAAISMELAA